VLYTLPIKLDPIEINVVASTSRRKVRTKARRERSKILLEFHELFGEDNTNREKGSPQSIRSILRISPRNQGRDQELLLLWWSLLKEERYQKV
jgi:hypothetical protein